MIKVYIAMPYGDANTEEQRLYNTEKAMAVWHTLADAGLIPFCPHLFHFLHEFRPRDRNHWLAQSCAWVESCDCVLALGDSEGVNAEAARALSLKKPVFRLISDLGAAYGYEI